ncbi:Aste57867_6094 [Aphanomyces stellatus]|uniref:Aste57867_6094 protein n=1 Tax=Aphanomyces stellatus TaxID=120398 RepID=A0A485KHQ1_9STRA|nr:hypothetical protein As57867_006080 [Aphanomyces stellatus]VFT83102.1 Aste57867_6094 [Aphanomyces stellatus]
MGSAYVVYVSCISEVGAKVPGGSYGLARAVLGFYPGFILGALELLEYISMGSVSVLFVADFCTHQFEWHPNYQPLLWLLEYLIFSWILSLRGKYVWPFILTMSGLAVLPVVLFLAGALGHTNFAYNAIWVDAATNATSWASGNIQSAFFAWVPYTTWGFAGVESLTVVTGFVQDPTVAIPKGTVRAVRTLFLSNLCLLFVVASLPPGIATTVHDDYLLSRGFQLGFGLSSTLAEWLIIPAQLGMAFGFFIPYARLMQAMADSNLLPPWLGLKNQPTTTRAMFVSSGFGYILCIISYYSPAFQTTLQNIALLAAAVCYAGQTYGFVLLRTSFKVDSNGYQSPFGIYGAYYVWCVFFVLFLSIAGGFQGDNGIAIMSFMGFIAVMSVYYRIVCLKHQTVSKEVYASIFKFSVMKFNIGRKTKLSKRSSAASSKSSRVSFALGPRVNHIAPHPPAKQ